MKPAFIILLFALAIILIAFPAQRKENISIVWISLEKETPFKDMEYNKEVSDYMKANSAKTGDKFLMQSFQQLYNVYLQNPNPKANGNLGFKSINTTNVNIGYNFSIMGNRTTLAVHYSTIKCGNQEKNIMLSEPQLYNASEAFIQNITMCIAKIIFSKNLTYVFVGTDHGLTLLTIKAAKILEPKSRIGIIVFDEHIDIYGLKDNDNIIGKENVFGKLLLEGYADYIIFLDASELAKQSMENSVSENFTKRDIFSKMEAYSDNELAGRKWQPILSRSIRNMKKEGITNIMVSVDLDVLPSGYMGFEYSAVAPAISAIKFGSNRSSISLAETEDGFSKGLEPVEIESYINYIKHQAAANNIKFGVGKNPAIIGDIQELLPKQDLGNETTKAAEHISQFLAKSFS